MKTTLSINVVMTCFNRKVKTLNCLYSLYNQKTDYQIRLNVFICDDGSTDGTSSEVLTRYPEVKIVKGTGNLFWARGMALALKKAKTVPCDFYLMVNDDVFFKDSMLNTMLSSYFELNSYDCAITGATEDPETHLYTYGGIGDISEPGGLANQRIYPSDPMKQCKCSNWNCFLLSSKYFEIIGDIDDYYEHSYADFDYSNRIRKNGGKVYVANSYIGFCKQNTYNKTWMDKSLPFKKRIKLLHLPNGIPFKSSVYYWKKYDKSRWILRVIHPYMVIIKDTILKKY